MNPMTIPSDFPVDFKLQSDGTAWHWYRKGGQNGPLLLQCRDYPELWSFHPGHYAGTIKCRPWSRPGVSWEEAKAQYIAWLLTNGDKRV